ncbi:MAG TPA: FIST N-terminal domain-containing protein [Noviherbaspirillum sp.]
MKTSQIILRMDSEFNAELQPLCALQPQLVLVFGAPPFFESPKLADTLRLLMPHAVIAGCSTAGEIAIDCVYDDTCVVTGVCFTHTPLAIASTAINGMDDSFYAGERLARMLVPSDLSAVLLFGTGVAVNGSALVSGLQAALPKDVTVSGGLAADGGNFRQTWTLGPLGAADDHIVAVGLYGKNIRFAYGNFAGWETFGPARKVTRCADNVLYELDGRRALDIYKSYLGEYAKDLPRSGLLFPFEMLCLDQQRSGIFRSIIGMNEEEGSLTLAGNIDANGYLKLMHSSIEKLIAGAEMAAGMVAHTIGEPDDGDALAILVSCVGRKLVMGDRIDEEIETVASLLGKKTLVTGFYSNGEFAGSEFYGECHLNNQTMAITWMREV